MANEEREFSVFMDAMVQTLDQLGSGRVYLVTDRVSKDRTPELCREFTAKDPRFVSVWSPENRCLVDACREGMLAALNAGHEFLIEMDAGLSHDPRAIPMFLRVLNEGNDCAFGSRFINGGSMAGSPWKRRVLSKAGTLAARLLLGTRLADMTSGFQGFHRSMAEKLVRFPFLSTAHFYQTEVRYLLRKTRLIEVPIHYRAPSPGVSSSSLKNCLSTLLHYFLLRVKGKSPGIFR